MLQVKEGLRFKYEFINQGSTVNVDLIARKFKVADKEFDIDSTVILDVGNCLTEGVIDVHHIPNGFQWKGQRIVSSSKLLTYFPSFLSNITDDVDQITIIVHEYPDFDCFASAYLARYFLENKRFPDFASELAQYAEEIDSGRLEINPNQVVTPYTITHVLRATTHEQRLNRGLKLIDYIIKRFSLLSENERDFESPVLFEEHHPFQEEKHILEEDFARYQKDLATRCEKQRMRLPCINGSTKEVDGLFWNTPATCSLDRLWARSDSTSPSGTGYVFTFVVKEPKVTNQVVLDRFKDNEEIRQQVSKTSHVFISVDGNSDVVLTDLGQMLENKERIVEEKIFGKEKKELWRTRSEIRFEDPLTGKSDDWIDNADPWYDGRNNQNTIVVVPDIGSLLTVNEIKQITLDYMIPKVKDSKINILYPFQFKIKKFTKLYECLKINERFNLNKNRDERITRYFRPYIQEYLFYKGTDKNGYSYTFENNKEMLCKVTIEDKKVSLVEWIEKQEKTKSNEIILKIKKNVVSLFRYGIGFVDIKVDLFSGELDAIPIDLLIEINKDLCEGSLKKLIVEKSKEHLIEENKHIEEFNDGLLYADFVLEHAAYFDDAKKEILYKLCSHTNWPSVFNSNSKHMKNTLERMYYDINEQMILGFSKRGSVLLIFDEDTRHLSPNQITNYNQKINEERKKFQTWDYYIFLMVLHQRFCLMNFSKELSEIGIKNELGKVAKLRDVLFEFIMQGWFSQITDDESGMDIHKRWIHVFETQTLHDEVLEQVSTIADHQNSKRDAEFSSKFNFVSILFLIITGVTGFFGMNIPIVDNWKDNEKALMFTVNVTFIFMAFWLGITLFNIIREKMK